MLRHTLCKQLKFAGGLPVDQVERSKCEFEIGDGEEKGAAGPVGRLGEAASARARRNPGNLRTVGAE